MLRSIDRRKTGDYIHRDRLLSFWLNASGVTVVSLLVMIIAFLFIESWPVIQSTSNPASFVTHDAWFPSTGEYGMLPMIVASLLVVSGALFLSIPTGIASALFIVYFAPAGFSRICQRIVELLAGLPSVVYGLWGIVVLVPIISSFQGPGSSLLAGILVLSTMLLPLMCLVAISSFNQLDPSQFNASYVLGLSKTATIWHIALPLASRNLMTGALLQTARALGETMAVLMVCGNVVNLPGSFFEPVRTLTANIALEAAYAMDLHRSALFVSGLILTLIVIIMLAVVHRSGERSMHVA